MITISFTKEEIGKLFDIVDGILADLSDVDPMDEYEELPEDLAEIWMKLRDAKDEE